jgi:hypothetical protein
VRLLVTAVAAVALATAACSNDTVLKESPEQIRQEQVTADAHNESTSTTTNPEAPPTTDPTFDPAFD